MSKDSLNRRPVRLPGILSVRTINHPAYEPWNTMIYSHVSRVGPIRTFTKRGFTMSFPIPLGGILLDIDGVLHVSMRPIPGAPDTLSFLTDPKNRPCFLPHTTTLP